MRIPIVLLAVAALALPLAARPSPAPGAPAIHPIYQDADSLKIEIAWSAPTTGNATVTGYSVMVTTFGWTRQASVAADVLTDTLWLPQDTVGVPAQICVRALAGERQGPFSCASWTVPAQVIIGPPGAPQVKVISAIGIQLDSITLATRRLDLAPGEETRLVPIGWIGPLSVACATLTDGRRGWAEAEIDPGDGQWRVTAHAFIPDGGCGWEWISTDPAVATVRTAESPI